MPNNPCSPNLAPTSPTRAGATTESVLAHRPPPYGGEHAAEPTSDHPTNTPNPAQKGEHKGEVMCITCGSPIWLTFWGPIGFGVCRDDLDPTDTDQAQHVAHLMAVAS